jgi:WD40 repeat protein
LYRGERGGGGGGGHTHTHTHPHTHTHTHTPTPTPTHPHTHAHTHTHPHTHTHTPTHARTHTHTHTLARPGTIKIWDLASGTLRLTLTGHISTVRGLAVSPRHPYLFSVGEDKQVKNWDLETNKVCKERSMWWWWWW